MCGPWTKFDPDGEFKLYKRYWFISYDDGCSPIMETFNEYDKDDIELCAYFKERLARKSKIGND